MTETMFDEPTRLTTSLKPLFFTTKVFLLGNTGISLICEEQVLPAGQIKLAGHQHSTFVCVLI